MNAQKQAYAYAIAAVICWSTVASVFKLSLRELSYAELVFYASLAATIVTGILLAFTGGFRALKAWSIPDLGKSALLGFLNPALYYIILFQAYDLLPAQEAQPLNMVWPFVLAIMAAVVHRQMLTRTDVLAMSLSFTGVLVIATRGDVMGMKVSSVEGVSLALGSSLIWAAYWTIGMKDKHPPLPRLFVNFCFGSAFALVYCLWTGALQAPSLTGLAGATYIGLFEMGITFALWLKAITLSKTAAQVSQLIFCVPFISLLIIHQVVGEPIYPSTLPGMALIVAGILWQQIASRKKARS